MSEREKIIYRPYQQYTEMCDANKTFDDGVAFRSRECSSRGVWSRAMSACDGRLTRGFYVRYYR